MIPRYVVGVDDTLNVVDPFSGSGNSIVLGATSVTFGVFSLIAAAKGVSVNTC
ncbi:MAG TPA: hypothetical protein VFP26_15615 [Gemmatimonadaceae bacterium]|nr:hypothetical protein [Gemmatimonadaceae bacterium]